MVNNVTPPPEVVAAMAVLNNYLSQNGNSLDMVVPPERRGTMRMFDGSIETKMWARDGEVHVAAPTGLTVIVNPVKLGNVVGEIPPPDSAFCIMAYNHAGGGYLRGDVATVYVGVDGLKLSPAGMEKIAMLYGQSLKLGK